MEKTMLEFKEKTPRLAALHLDAILIKGLQVSRALIHLDGKLLNLSVTKMVGGSSWYCYGTDSVFDTTASNSGVRKGANVRLMQVRGRLVFWSEWLACAFTELSVHY